MLSPAARSGILAALRPRVVAPALSVRATGVSTAGFSSAASSASTPAPYRSYIQPEADAEFPAARDRYHLYVAYSCPFACRALVARSLKGLEDVVGVSVAHPIFQKTKPEDPADTHRGWTFVDPATEPTITGLHGKEYPTDGCVPDTVNHVRFVRDLYEKVDPTPRKFSVPVLWDKKKQTIVSNESADIVRTLNTGFRELVPSTVDLLPPALEQQVEAANSGIVVEVSQPYFKAAFAHSAEETQDGLLHVFPAIAKLDQRLSAHRFVVDGTDDITEADVRLFHLLIRVDVAQRAESGQPTLNNFPNVVGYLRDLYQRPAFKRTVNWDHLRMGLINHNPLGPILSGPSVDYDAPHGRA